MTCPYGVLSVVVLALGTLFDGSAEPQSQPSSEDWLSGFIESARPRRDALLVADVRNGKLFGNRHILSDIDEKELFADDTQYKAAIGMAGRWLQKQFPVLADAFVEKRVEACANGGQVYLRGRAPLVDFVAVVPLADVTGCEPRGPWSITFVSRDEDHSGKLQALASQAEKEPARRVGLFLARFGDIGVKGVRPPRTETQPTAVHIDGEGDFRQLEFSGRLTVVVSQFVTCIELSDLRGSGPGFAKPFLVKSRPGTRREPDWTGETNILSDKSTDE